MLKRKLRLCNGSPGQDRGKFGSQIAEQRKIERETPKIVMKGREISDSIIEITKIMC
jgi:hypothetical protein